MPPARSSLSSWAQHGKAAAWGLGTITDTGTRMPRPPGTAAAAYRGRLRVALSITLTVMVVEIVGGVLADSLALLSDAAHI